MTKTLPGDLLLFTATAEHPEIKQEQAGDAMLLGRELAWQMSEVLGSIPSTRTKKVNTEIKQEKARAGAAFRGDSSRPELSLLNDPFLYHFILPSRRMAAKVNPPDYPPKDRCYSLP